VPLTEAVRVFRFSQAKGIPVEIPTQGVSRIDPEARLDVINGIEI
jgi:hypothetical protein